MIFVFIPGLPIIFLYLYKKDYFCCIFSTSANVLVSASLSSGYTICQFLINQHCQGSMQYSNHALHKQMRNSFCHKLSVKQKLYYNRHNMDTILQTKTDLNVFFIIIWYVDLVSATLFYV